MKKIYYLAVLSVFGLGTYAQTLHKSAIGNSQKVSKDQLAKLRPAQKALNKTQGGAFDLTIDPVGNLLAAYSNTANVGIFLNPIFMDSTVKSSFTTTDFISTCGAGTVLDPKSPSINPDLSFTPLLSSNDSYTLDSVFVYGSYIKIHGSQTDTLYTYVVWGDTANTTVFRKLALSAAFIAPISTWGGTFVGPKVTGAASAAGNPVKAAAGSSNMVLIKRVLTNNDTVTSPGSIQRIGMKLPTAQTIPAGNVVSAFYTFVPGASYSVGDVVYASSSAPSAQTQNGFAGIVYQQTSPTLASDLSNIQQYLFDPQGKNSGLSYDSGQRHNQYPTSWSTFYAADYVGAPVMEYHITGTSTTGINELESNGFVLGQNAPNPFSKESTVRYQLAKDVKSVKFTVTDLMGRIIAQSTEATSAGTHSINLNSLNAGVYYYSLTVDGKSTTKKMIVQ